jgi:hypothetical protein
MANGREQLVASISEVLRRSSIPLKAREIADKLNSVGHSVTKTDVNSVLYCELSNGGMVAQDGQFRWSLRNAVLEQSASSSNPQIVGAVAPVASTEPSSNPEKCRAARRVLQTLRSGTTSGSAARAISVGTKRLEEDLYAKVDSLFQDGAKGQMVVIAADWGFGKSHMRMLLSSHLSERGIPFVHECVDARAASLAHIHRSVPRWLERIQIGRTIGLRDALNNSCIPIENALAWARSSYTDFAYGLRVGLDGHEWGWLRALGHFYRTPDNPYQHPKAWALFDEAAGFLNKMGLGGLVLLLDEAENIDKQYDIRGRRKSYDTLAKMMQHRYLLPVVFVTDRLINQVQEDHEHGRAHAWDKWTADAKWFVGNFLEIEPLRPPRMNDRLAGELASSIAAMYRQAYAMKSMPPIDRILTHWRQTSTKSTRLLVRLTINELDIHQQNGLGH